MKDKFTAVYNTLCMIETKGEYTKMMSDCLRFLEKCILECDENEKELLETVKENIDTLNVEEDV